MSKGRMYFAVYDQLHCMCGDKQVFDPATQWREERGKCTSDCSRDPHFKCGGKGTAGDVYEFRKMIDGNYHTPIFGSFPPL